jgi:hypothetical protein
MRIRRPIAVLFTALALFGGGATMTACQAAGQDQNDGTTDDSGEQDSGDVQEETDQGDDSDQGDDEEGSGDVDDDPAG